MNAIDFVDYKLNRLVDELPLDEESVQVTLRLPISIRHKADVVSDFLSITRNSLFVAFLDESVQSAFCRLEDNPVISDMKINGMTPSEAYQALLSGKLSTVKGGLSPEESEEFLESEGV